MAVGPTQQLFTIHRDIISERSSFFKAACNERWSRADSSKTVKLPDDNAEIFSVYLNCVYKNVVITHELESAEADVLDEPEGAETETFGLDPTAIACEKKFALPIRTYILADKLGDLKSCNLIIDEIIVLSDQWDKIPSYMSYDTVYMNTAPGSPLRGLLVDYCVHEGTNYNAKDLMDRAPSEFVVDVLGEMFRLKDGIVEDDGTVGVGGITFGLCAIYRAKRHYHQHNENYPACG